MVPRVRMLIIKNSAAHAFLSLLLLTLVLAGCTPRGPRALLDGKKLLEQERYPEATEKLQLATQLMNTNAVAWNYLGLAYHHSGLSTNAEYAYSKALALDRDLVEAKFNLGCLRLETGQFEPAKNALMAYTALRGNAPEGWVRLGTAEYHLEEMAAAEKSFIEALHLDNKNAEAWNGLGLIQVQRRDFNQATQFFTNALIVQADFAPALLNLAIVNQSYLNNRAVALQKYREYLALPNRTEKWEAVNEIAQSLEEELNPQSTAAAVPATRTEPARPETRIESARRNPEPEQIARSSPEPVAKPARDSSASSRSANVVRAETPATKPSVAKEESKEKGGFLHQINPMNLFRRGSKSNETADQTKPARSAASSEVASGFPRYQYRNPPRPATGDSSAAETVFNQGSRAHQAGRLAEAVQSYENAIRLDPAFFQAYYNLALAAAANGNLSQALTAYETALAIRPDSLDARYNFAVMLKQANYILDAEKQLENLLADHPNEARAHIALANIFARQLRQPAKAREHYTKALELDPGSPQAPAIRYWLSSH